MKLRLMIAIICLMLLVASMLYWFTKQETEEQFVSAELQSQPDSHAPEPEYVTHATQPVTVVSPPARSDNAVQSSPDPSPLPKEQSLRNGLLPKMRYEDDWCNAYLQLNAADFERSQEDLNEFILSRGGAQIAEFPEEMGNSELLLRNNVYVESYQEMPLEDLRVLSAQGDKMAMITLVQRPDARQVERHAIAQELLILGDTQQGLGQLVSTKMQSAALRFKETGEADEKVKSELLSALAMVEYGLQRKDLYALGAYLTFVGKKDYHIYGLDPETVLSDEELQQVPHLKRQLWQEIEEARIANHLPSLMEEEIPESAVKHFDEMLALMHVIYPGYMESARIMVTWRDNYLHQSDCTVRQIAVFNQQMRLNRDQSRVGSPSGK